MRPGARVHSEKSFAMCCVVVEVERADSGVPCASYPGNKTLAEVSADRENPISGQRQLFLGVIGSHCQRVAYKLVKAVSKFGAGNGLRGGADASQHLNRQLHLVPVHYLVRRTS